jgi:hypothetical protein
MNTLKFLMVGLLILIVCGCAPFMGGGSYKYKRYDPATGETIEVAVESAREIESADVHFGSDGTVDVKVKGVTPGPDNLGEALHTIRDLVKLGKAGAGGAL